MQMYFFCGYDQHYVDKQCQGNPPQNGEQTYSLNFPKGDKIKLYTCSSINQFNSGSYEYLKLEFICRDRTEPISIFALVILMLTILLFIGSISLCVYMAKTKEDVPEALLDPNNAGRPLSIIDRAEMQEFAQKQKMKAIQKILRTVKWSTVLKESEGKDDVDATCCICVEDFKGSMEVKQTPCGHVFHNDCLFKWVETKIASPDCPSCRQPFDIKKELEEVEQE